MFSRVTLVEIDTLRADIDLVLERFRDTVLPDLRRRPGYEGIFMMVSPEGRGLIMTLWSDEDAMRATAELAAGAVEQFMTVFRAPPGREQYEVRLAEPPAASVG